MWILILLLEGKQAGGVLKITVQKCGNVEEDTPWWYSTYLAHKRPWAKG
jgi:hypothetical protein